MLPKTLFIWLDQLACFSSCIILLNQPAFLLSLDFAAHQLQPTYQTCIQSVDSGSKILNIYNSISDVYATSNFLCQNQSVSLLKKNIPTLPGFLCQQSLIQSSALSILPTSRSCLVTISYFCTMHSSMIGLYTHFI